MEKPDASNAATEFERYKLIVETLEAVVEEAPNDIQSLDTLKEAYINLARDGDAANISNKIAEAYLRLGQLSSAILEYEGILQKFPDDAQSLAKLDKLQVKMANVSSRVRVAAHIHDPGKRYEDSNEALIRFLQEHRLLAEKEGKVALSAIKAAVQETETGQPVPSLVSILAEHDFLSVDKTLSFLSKKMGLPYLPLSICDVDRARPIIIEREFCMRHLLLVFGKVSTTFLVATVNPFDTHAQNHVHANTRGRFHWYLTDPVELTKALKDLFRNPTS